MMRELTEHCEVYRTPAEQRDEIVENIAKAQREYKDRMIANIIKTQNSR